MEPDGTAQLDQGEDIPNKNIQEGDTETAVNGDWCEDTATDATSAKAIHNQLFPDANMEADGTVVQNGACLNDENESKSDETTSEMREDHPSGDQNGTTSHFEVSSDITTSIVYKAPDENNDVPEVAETETGGDELPSGEPNQEEEEEEESAKSGTPILTIQSSTTTTHVFGDEAADQNGELEVSDTGLEGPEVALSNEEAQLLEKLKYQPFDVAQELQSLTSQQREKINMYQRRESLARANSLKRQSPSASISLAHKRASESSQGRRNSELSSSAAVDSNMNTTNSTVAVKTMQNGFEPSSGEGVAGKNEKDVDTNTELYNQMRLLTPKPYSLSQSRSSYSNHGTPDLGETRKHQRFSTLPTSSSAGRTSAGDLILGRDGDSTNQKLDRSQSVKAQADIDKTRKHMYAMRMKFLGLEVPAVYPYSSVHLNRELNGNADDDVVEDEDMIVENKKVTVESKGSLPSTSRSSKAKANGSKAGVKDKKDDSKDKKSNKQPSKSSFFGLLCGSGRNKNDDDDIEE